MFRFVSSASFFMFTGLGEGVGVGVAEEVAPGVLPVGVASGVTVGLTGEPEVDGGVATGVALCSGVGLGVAVEPGGVEVGVGVASAFFSASRTLWPFCTIKFVCTVFLDKVRYTLKKFAFSRTTTTMLT